MNRGVKAYWIAPAIAADDTGELHFYRAVAHPAQGGTSFAAMRTRAIGSRGRHAFTSATLAGLAAVARGCAATALIGACLRMISDGLNSACAARTSLDSTGSSGVPSTSGVATPRSASVKVFSAGMPWVSAEVVSLGVVSDAAADVVA